ncbi:NAD(P)-dependent oxidoreductase [Franconibacter helveticus]|uniref:NAD(P)-dependent oxidoreductase n=1 Tax=Franconibacter helveticus TaxID=357240 RepID=UPI002906976B|nr:NAD(P)-dependent oxidoreductase [Franconibacter helveticus]MDU6924128.1 NAD(P)-dependent oxidoreductase [Franconibacter helveticus]
MHIAFLGLGGMGQPMALNLLKAGYALTVWNRSPEPAQALAEQGATVAATPADIAPASVLITILADDIATEQVVVGQGALAALARGAIWINMATVSVAFTEEMEKRAREKGIAYIAAPVLGRVDVAAAGNLNILTAGEATLLDKVQEIFDVLGQKTWRFGERPAQAATVKLAANFMLASAIEAMGEASALVEVYDVAKGDFLGMLTSTLFAAPAYKNYGAMIAEDRYSPAGFTMKLGLKDVRLAQQAAESKNVPMGIAGVLRDNYLDALAHGDEKLDWAALATVSARRSGQS